MEFIPLTAAAIQSRHQRSEPTSYSGLLKIPRCWRMALSLFGERNHERDAQARKSQPVA